MNEMILTPLVLTVLGGGAFWGLMARFRHRWAALLALGLSGIAAALGFALAAWGPGGVDPVMGALAIFMGFGALVLLLAGIFGRIEIKRDVQGGMGPRIAGLIVLILIVVTIAAMAG